MTLWQAKLNRTIWNQSSFSFSLSDKRNIFPSPRLENVIVESSVHLDCYVDFMPGPLTLQSIGWATQRLTPTKDTLSAEKYSFHIIRSFFSYYDTGTDSHMLAHPKLVHLFNLNLRRNLNEGLNEAGSAGRGRNEAN